MTHLWSINTSNKGKLNEYLLYLNDTNLTNTTIDLKEPDSDPITIICYKASQFEGKSVIVDDVSLDMIDPTIKSPGTNIRWLIDQMDTFIGKKAYFSCLIGIQKNDKIHIYQGKVIGTIVKPVGDGFGFGPFFLPDGTNKTLGEYMDPKYNARYLAIQNLVNDIPIAILDPIVNWEGEFQHY